MARMMRISSSALSQYHLHVFVQRMHETGVRMINSYPKIGPCRHVPRLLQLKCRVDGAQSPRKGSRPVGRVLVGVANQIL